MSNINYSLSYAMFDNNDLVGFILHGIENRYNHLTAFNLATGVIPEYRGKKITKIIYEYAIPDLMAHGISKCQLEVIKENDFAIRAYESIGFSIMKEYKCFAGAINIGEDYVYKPNEIKIQDFNFDLISNQKAYSWENQIESIRRGNFKCFQVMDGNDMESYFIINSNNGYIPQFEVLIDKKEVWERLFSTINKTSSKIKINNVDVQLVNKIYYLEKFGIKNTIDQYEMGLNLK